MKTLLTFGLSTTVKTDTFYKLLGHAEVYEHSDDEDEYIDASRAESGMIVRYRDGRTKQIGVLFNVPYRTYEVDPEESLQRIEHQIRKYFSKRFCLNDFLLSRLAIEANLKLDEDNRADDYMTVLRRVGNVKGYTLHSDRKSGKYICHHWQGNSNNTDVILRSSKGQHMNLAVHMLKSQAVRAYTQEWETQAQIIKSLTELEDSLVTLLSGILPFGRFLKKADAIQRIRYQISNDTLRRKMIRLLELVPEKKSIKRAMKVSGYRNLKDIMLAFARIDLSPVTISKRMLVRELKNLYMYL